MIESLIIAGLAVWQWVDLLHHALIFRWLRQLAHQWYQKPFLWWLGYHFKCPYCLSLSGSFFVFAMLHTPILHWVVYVLAVSRLANLLNDSTKSIMNTPRYEINDGIAAPEIMFPHDV